MYYNKNKYVSKKVCQMGLWKKKKELKTIAKEVC